jgi:hypothetical protein
MDFISLNGSIHRAKDINIASPHDASFWKQNVLQIKIILVCFKITYCDLVIKLFSVFK